MIPVIGPEVMRYFSAKEGRLVSRFGTKSYIGATVQVVERKTKIVWDPEEIVAVPPGEYAKFAREYNRALRDGSLVERKKADYEKWTSNQRAKSEKDAPAKTKETVK